MKIRARCPKCKNPLAGRDFQAVNDSGKVIGSYLGYSRNKGEKWKCENCGFISHIPQPKNINA